MAFSNSPRIPRENLVLALDPADTNSYRRLSAVEVMVVGGGGGGGMDMGGGGGGGGVIYQPNYKVTPGTEYTVTVGAGGYGAPAGGTYRTDGAGPQPGGHQFTVRATNGGDSVFGNIVAKGGGYGASSYYGYLPDYGYGGTGASGGGCSGYTHGGERYVDSNNYPGQGYPGGNSGNPASGGDDHYSGGGGGAGTRGTSGPNHSGPNGTRGHGGDGVIIPRMSPYWYGGGGGGAGYSGGGGNGGKGGGGGGADCSGAGIGYGDTNGRNAGGNGSSGCYQPGGNGGANTGGGGGGGSHYNSNNKGGEGGSGIVIVRYNGPQAATGGTYSFENGVSYHTFTSSGVFTPGTVSGNMYDISGNKRNATVAGTAIITSNNPPVFTFNNPGAGSGQPDYIEFSNGNTSGFNPIYFPYVSITVAFRFNALNDYWERIFDFGRGGNNVSNVSYNAVILTRYSTTSDIHVYTHGSYIGYQSTSFDTGLNVDLGTWQVITLTWEAGSQKIYKNGSLFGQWTNAYSLIDHLGPNRTDERYLLARSNWNDAGAKISYGPFYIHNRILSISEITSLHSNIQSRFGL